MATRPIMDNFEWLTLSSAKSFIPLLNNSKLLFYWSKTHPRDTVRIAKIISHRKFKHELCKSDEECQIIEEWLKKVLT